MQQQQLVCAPPWAHHVVVCRRDLLYRVLACSGPASHVFHDHADLARLHIPPSSPTTWLEMTLVFGTEDVVGLSDDDIELQLPPGSTFRLFEDLLAPLAHSGRFMGQGVLLRVEGSGISAPMLARAARRGCSAHLLRTSRPPALVLTTMAVPDPTAAGGWVDRFGRDTCTSSGALSRLRCALACRRPSLVLHRTDVPALLLCSLACAVAAAWSSSPDDGAGSCCRSVLAVCRATGATRAAVHGELEVRPWTYPARQPPSAFPQFCCDAIRAKLRCGAVTMLDGLLPGLVSSIPVGGSLGTDAFLLFVALARSPPLGALAIARPEVLLGLDWASLLRRSRAREGMMLFACACLLYAADPAATLDALSYGGGGEVEEAEVRAVVEGWCGVRRHARRRHGSRSSSHKPRRGASAAVAHVADCMLPAVPPGLQVVLWLWPPCARHAPRGAWVGPHPTRARLAAIAEATSAGRRLPA